MNSLYEQLQKAKANWLSKNYMLNIHRSFMESRRDNEVQAIDNLLIRYDILGYFSVSEERFAIKLINNAKK